MPEGDTVHQLSDRLSSLVGRRITAWDARVPSLATTDATGMEIAAVWAWGKHLFWRLNSDAGSDILHTHLRMDGHWESLPVGQRWRAPAHTARLVVRVEGSPNRDSEVELVGHDLGMVDLWPASQYDARTAHLGPDPLHEHWGSPGQWPTSGRDESVKRLAAQRGTTLGEAVLDQRVIAGLGTVYRAELCFLLGLHPASAVDARDAAAVVDLAAELLQANRHRMRVFTGSARPGMGTYVYGRQRLPCRRCGTRIEKDTLGGATSVADPRAGQERLIHWCPHCQPLV